MEMMGVCTALYFISSASGELPPAATGLKARGPNSALLRTAGGAGNTARHGAGIPLKAGFYSGMGLFPGHSSGSHLSNAAKSLFRSTGFITRSFIPASLARDTSS